MPLPVKLREVAEEMDVVPEGWTAYLNCKTGELYSFADELEEHEDEGDEEEDEFEPEELAKAREILGSADWLPLPTRFDIHMYDIMRRYCDIVEDQALRDQLHDALRGSGAFRRFKDLVEERGVEESWYQFRDAALDEIARGWLEDHEIPYVK